MNRPRRLPAAWCWSAALLILGPAQGFGQEVTSASKTLGTIERHDPRFDKLIPPGATVEKLADGFDWSEGPVWDRKQGLLLFSDVPMNTVYRWREGMAKPAVFLKPSGYTGASPRGGEPGSNGLTSWTPRAGSMLCQHGDRRIARLEADGTFKTLVDNYQGKKLNSPNDAAYHSDGSLYFTDPPYGLLGKNKPIRRRRLPFNGVYRLSKDWRADLADQGDDLSPTESASRPTRRRSTSPTPTPIEGDLDGLPTSRPTAPWAQGGSSSTRLGGSRRSRGCPTA